MKKRTSNIPSTTIRVNSRRMSKCEVDPAFRFHGDEPGGDNRCEDCGWSETAGGRNKRILTCRNKADSPGRVWVVESNGHCANFSRDKELLGPEHLRALDEGARLIPLTQGEFAIVDAEDYERVNQYRWCLMKTARANYAKSKTKVRLINGKRTKCKTILMHRLIRGEPKGLFVDHINHNGLDNRKCNLRLCTRVENNLNRRPCRGKTSRYKGVFWHKKKNRYHAAITYQKKRFFLGSFKKEVDAAKAYDKKAKELFGQFAYLNFPMDRSQRSEEG